ncbi:MAG: dihydroorotase [Tepidimonas sp.]
MKILIRQGRVIDPASGTDRMADVAIAAGRVIGIGSTPADFAPNRVIDASGCWVLPGLVDLSVRLREPGQEHAGMLESETAAAVAGGVTSLVCPPDTDPVLDEPGLVDMLKARAEKLHRARLFPLGALTRGLQGEVLAEMVQLTERGCVAFSQADRPILNTQVLQRAFQYAATFGYTLWLRPEEPWLSKGVMASGPLATRLGLSGVSAASEVIALHTLFELLRGVAAAAGAAVATPPVRLHVCRLSTAAGVALVRQAKAEGLPVTADVSVHNLLLTDTDIGYYDTRLRLQPPVRQQRDRDALRQALADGTIDALVSDHNPVSADAKAVPFAEAEPGATAVELLAGLALVVDQLPDEGGMGLAAMALRLPLLFSLACLMSQRLHDIGRAGRWIWPILGGVFALNAVSDGEATAIGALAMVGVLGLWPGQTAFNRYGAPPAGLSAFTGPKTS